MHGVSRDVDFILDNLRTKEEDGISNTYSVVEDADGLAPGVFVIVKGQNTDVAN